ncbi:MAG TPA: cupin domain-containing protein [Vicinamibacteria bacterium]|jgi:1,2-dihydroxy-3-keto-5-methylthiopentene dioxygenase
MATVTIPDEGRRLTEAEAVRAHLRGAGIDYERWETARDVPDEAPGEEVLRAYAPEIERLKAAGGYVTADVIDVSAQTPNLETMLARFRSEHWHDEDEVRFIVRGRGLFHIRPRQGAVFAVEVEAGDLIRVPRGTWHWFDLCADRRIRAIRLFQDPSGWTPHYTESGVDARFAPVCFGPRDLPPDA